MPGSIDPSDDEDFFRIVLTSETDLWVYASGSDDTVGQVQDSNGVVKASNDDGILLDGRLNFSIRAELPAGTYYVRVTSFGARETAAYTIHARAATDPGNTKETATPISPDSMTPARIGPQGGDSGANYFKLELNRPTDIWVMAVGRVDTFGQLIDADNDSVLVQNDDSEFPDNERGFMLRRRLEARTYYIKVRGYLDDDTGPYTLFVRTATEPGSTSATARPMSLRIPETGRISSAGDTDYFSLTLEEETYIYGYALAFGGDPLPLTPTIFDSSNTAVDDLYVIPHEVWADNGIRKASFSVWGKLDAGTYYIKIAPSSGDTGRYLLQIRVSAYGSALERCTGLTTAQSDPWYGCQWHLNNTNQFPRGAGRDINVEEAWATTMGAGINIAVVDDGLHYAHEDLADNVLTARNHDYFGDDVFDPLETHGTQVAGIIAARDNGLGVRGVAPRASIYNYNVIEYGLPSDVNAGDAMTRNKADTAVSNNSWGPPRMLGFTSATWEGAIVNGVTNGYGGKGVFYVFAGGNDDPEGQDSNLDEYANHYGVTAVCAVNHNDVKTAYSERGANLWVCAPSGDRTRGIPGDRDREERRPLHGFVLRHVRFGADRVRSGGPGARRQLRSDLARREADPRGLRPQERSVQQHLAAGGAEVRRDRRFDPRALLVQSRLRLRCRWTLAPPSPWRRTGPTCSPNCAKSRRSRATSTWRSPDSQSIRSGTTVTTSLTIDSYVGFVEFVEINATFNHTSFRDVQVDLISPSGARSRLVPAVYLILGESMDPADRETFTLTERFRFGSARHLGENAAGTWTLRITDLIPGHAGTLESWSLKIYGHGSTAGVPLVTTTPVNQALAVEWTAPDDTGDPDAENHLLRRPPRQSLGHVQFAMDPRAARLDPGPRRPALRHPQPRE